MQCGVFLVLFLFIFAPLLGGGGDGDGGDGAGCYGNIMNVDTTGASSLIASQDGLSYTSK